LISKTPSKVTPRGRPPKHGECLKLDAPEQSEAEAVMTTGYIRRLM